MDESDFKSYKNINKFEFDVQEFINFYLIDFFSEVYNVKS